MQSDPEEEFEEILLKARAPMAAIARAVTGSDSPDAWTVELRAAHGRGGSAVSERATGVRLSVCRDATRAGSERARRDQRRTSRRSSGAVQALLLELGRHASAASPIARARVARDCSRSPATRTLIVAECEAAVLVAQARGRDRRSAHRQLADRDPRARALRADPGPVGATRPGVGGRSGTSCCEALVELAREPTHGARRGRAAARELREHCATEAFYLRNGFDADRSADAPGVAVGTERAGRCDRAASGDRRGAVPWILDEHGRRLPGHDTTGGCRELRAGLTRHQRCSARRPTRRRGGRPDASHALHEPDYLDALARVRSGRARV